MRVSDGLKEGLALPTGDLVLNRFRNEATSVSLELIDFVKEVRGQRNRDPFSARHIDSMT
jgi:hypothetical protein